MCRGFQFRLECEAQGLACEAHVLASEAQRLAPAAQPLACEAQGLEREAQRLASEAQVTDRRIVELGGLQGFRRQRDLGLHPSSWAGAEDAHRHAAASFADLSGAWR